MNETHSAYFLLILIVLYVSFMIYVYQTQVIRIKNQVDSSENLLPICRSFVEVLIHVDDINILVPALENSKFRYIWMTLYDLNGEVWADGRVSCYGKLPMPPSEVQSKTFHQLKKEGVLDETKTEGIMFNVFSKCELNGKKSSKLIAAMKVPNKDLILCLQQCGEKYV